MHLSDLTNKRITVVHRIGSITALIVGNLTKEQANYILTGTNAKFIFLENNVDYINDSKPDDVMVFLKHIEVCSECGGSGYGIYGQPGPDPCCLCNYIPGS